MDKQRLRRSLLELLEDLMESLKAKELERSLEKGGVTLNELAQKYNLPTDIN